MSGVTRLIVGTSGSPGSLQALRYGESLAQAHHALLVPVIAWELPGDDRAHRIGSSRELGKACSEVAGQQLRDALIVGAGRRGALGRLVFSGVGRYCVAHAQCRSWPSRRPPWPASSATASSPGSSGADP